MQSAPRHLTDVFLHSGRRFPERVALGRRNSKGGEATTYGALLQGASHVAAGLVALGLRPGDRIGVIADNDADWLETDLGIHFAGCVSVPRGADTAPAEVRYILAHSESRVAFVQSADVAALLGGGRKELPHLQRTLLMHGGADRGEVNSLVALRELGRTHLRNHPRCLDAQREGFAAGDLATIVYTSGTTAEPKGVMLTHENLLHNVLVVPTVLRFTEQDLFLSLLPSWHMFERILEYVVLSIGAGMVYTDPRRLKEDLTAVRPTVLAAVPRIWETIYRGISTRLEQVSGLKRSVFDACLKIGRRAARGEASPIGQAMHRLLRKTVFAPFQQAVGGRLAIAVSGGGALPAHVDELLLALGIPLLNGYGLTETSPVVSVRRPEANCVGTIGPPLRHTEIEIRAENGTVLGHGQTGLIWIRGPQVMKGYYKNPDATERCMDAAGWFNSGDLGHVKRDGQLCITGRAKDTIVLLGGENVEPEPVENGIKTSPLVLQAVVLGQDQKQPGALLVPDAQRLEESIPRVRWDESAGLLRSKEVRALLRKELDRTLTREAGFRPVDKVGPFRVLAQPFTKEDGSLTPTLKIKRRVVVERWGALIQEMFADPSG